MDNKKVRIIEESMKLFSEKGFHATSIQQIANKSEVSKGAFYLHFDSKDELLVAIFDHYTSIVMEKLQHIDEHTENPKQQFEEQIHMFIELFQDHKEYLMIHFRDNIKPGDKMDELMIRVNRQGFDWTRKILKAMYGEKVTPYVVDLAIQIDGLIQGYFKWIAVHNLTFDTKKLAAYIAKQVDILVTAVIEQNEQPMFTQTQLQYQFNESEQENPITPSDIIKQLDQKIENMKIEGEEHEELKDALHVIQEEINKEKPKSIILKSMLDHLEQYGPLKYWSNLLAQTYQLKK
ncbi:TetR/AcrR family transcriptional regulator [Gracilibacillus sp. YIM 98692]|uniref:TetR/AcrR family transcriptional regulator n=1 Tax=Gracilibacillus sp. YIM 98692 TaxID=2663532 RepID=UPI0013D72CE3|nr:TetR/AcrR family transcriptional regulator [Gracilibacillus sp. YIM 98692]